MIKPPPDPSQAAAPVWGAVQPSFAFPSGEDRRNISVFHLCFLSRPPWKQNRGGGRGGEIGGQTLPRGKLTAHAPLVCTLM